MYPEYNINIVNIVPIFENDFPFFRADLKIIEEYNNPDNKEYDEYYKNTISVSIFIKSKNTISLLDAHNLAIQEANNFLKRYLNSNALNKQ